MEKNIGSQIEIAPMFSTPVARLKVPNADELNLVLEAAILKREAQQGGVHKTNIGGWHSDFDLMEWPEVVESGFGRILRDVCHQLIGRQAKASRFSGQLDLTAWANVNRKGTYNIRHNHPGSLWSGVHYIQAGDYSAENNNRAGCLQLDDPRGSINMYTHPGGSNFGASFRIKPEEGLLIIFPSWLYHSVNTFQSDTTRISISFNSKFSSFQDNSKTGATGA